MDPAQALSIAVIREGARDYKRARTQEDREKIDKEMRQAYFWYDIIGCDPSIWDYIKDHKGDIKV